MKAKLTFKHNAPCGTPLQRQHSPGKYLISFLLLVLISLSIPQKASAAGKPAQITGMKCGVTTKSSINISWSPQSGVSGYQVYRASSYDGPYKKIKTIAAGNHAFCNMKLQGGKEYFYRVRAYRGSSVGKFSKILTARTSCTARAATVRVSANVRKHAGTNHPIVATLSPGTKVTVSSSTITKSGTPWSRISFHINGRKKSGYIRSDLLTSGKAKQNTGTVTATWLNLRSSASARSSLITSLPKGTKVTILNQTTGADQQKWYHISVKRNGRTLKGYVSARYVQVS